MPNAGYSGFYIFSISLSYEKAEKTAVRSIRIQHVVLTDKLEYHIGLFQSQPEGISL